MSRQGEALDTLRWGDNIPVQLTGAAALVGISSSSSRQQIAKAQWRWPLLWGVRFIVSVQSADAGQPAFTVKYQVTIGSGQNSSTCEFDLTSTPTAVGAYPLVTDFEQLPACDVQVTAVVSSSVALGAGVTSTIYAGAYLAPVTEPHAMTEMLEHMRGDAESRGLRWMDGNPHAQSHTNPGTGIAFPVNPDPLKYQPR